MLSSSSKAFIFTSNRRGASINSGKVREVVCGADKVVTVQPQSTSELLQHLYKFVFLCLLLLSCLKHYAACFCCCNSTSFLTVRFSPALKALYIRALSMKKWHAHSIGHMQKETSQIFPVFSLSIYLFSTCTTAIVHCICSSNATKDL